MLKRGFLTIELSLAIFFLSLVSYFIFSGLSQIIKNKKDAAIIYTATNLASQALEEGFVAQQQNNFKATLVEEPTQYGLKKITVTVRHKDGMQATMWTIK